MFYALNKVLLEDKFSKKTYVYAQKYTYYFVMCNEGIKDI
tara:strand:- start:99 stop:218 length:120 start_codon:yes stop_codon:yes gene_type:complete